MPEEEEKTEEKPEEKKPEEKKPEEEKPEEEKPEKVTVPKKKGGWFQKIPTGVLLSPGGMVLIFFALVMEIIDLIPLPIVDQLWELPFEIVFIALLVIIAKVPLKTSLIPFLIERIPIISDVLPTWVIRMLM